LGKDILSEVQQDARYWMLVEGAARVTQALAPHVAHFLFIKSAEYHVNPVSSIQHQVSWSISGSAFLSK